MSDSRSPGRKPGLSPSDHASGAGTGHGPREEPRGVYLAFLSLAALGVVFGDIGTSPIYAFRESLHGSHGVAQTATNVMGVLSLIFWSLVIVISIKYLGFVMRADNRGEGGVIALTALVSPPSPSPKAGRAWLVLIGLFGAALLYGDSMITPAISVLSAIEGLEVVTPVFTPYVVPITVVILFGLFSIQRHGTARVGSAFGPVVLVWFIVLGALGVLHIRHNPAVLEALNPLHAIEFFGENGRRGFLVLGTVFLVVTGGEALYADMGHFGRRPIRLTWFAVVLPALLLNYFGQGALVIAQPEAIEQPFYLMAPSWALIPLVVLATAATVIASQAVISGAFSLTRQAVQLGYLPRMQIAQTSEREIGQVYIPTLNWILMLAAIGLVLGFRSSSRLAAAYGVAVTTDMVFTTLLFARVAVTRFGWSGAAVGLLTGAFLTVDLSFWGANLPKIPHGGWFPLLVAAVLFIMMTTWREGRLALGRLLRGRSLPTELFVEQVNRNSITRVPGTAVYMHSGARGVPPALLHNLKHNKVLHEKVLLLRVETKEVPYVETGERVESSMLAEGLWEVAVRYGFAQSPHIPAALARNEVPGFKFKPMETTYFLGRERLLPVRKGPMRLWRARLFARMSRNALGATSFFGLPPNRVVELGAQIEI